MFINFIYLFTKNIHLKINFFNKIFKICVTKGKSNFPVL